MGRKLRDKLPKVTIASEKLSEGERRNLILERAAAAKQKQKEYVDKHRLAPTSDIHEGDTILVKQLHKTNKLTPKFESVPSQVIRMDGNAVIVQSPGGPLRMRNSAHVKKFILTTVTTRVVTSHVTLQRLFSRLYPPLLMWNPRRQFLALFPQRWSLSLPCDQVIRNAPALMEDFVSK